MYEIVLRSIFMKEGKNLYLTAAQANTNSSQKKHFLVFRHFLRYFQVYV